MAATAHLGLFHFNRRRGRTFVFNAITSAFCITRIIAASLRMGWAVSPSSISLACSMHTFVSAGIIILILTNLFFAQRLVRAQHPRFGWKKPFSFFIGLWVLLCCVAVFLMIVSFVVQAYLPDPFSQHSARRMQLFSNVIFAMTAILPIPIAGVSTIAKSHPTLKAMPIDNFGRGSLNRKMVIIFSSATILSIGAIGTSFYLFDFTLDFSLVILWLVVRIDAQFIIPDGSDGPMTYGNGFHFARRSRGARSPIERCSTLPTRSFTRDQSWGTLRKYMVEEEKFKGLEGRVRTPVSRLQTPISRPEMIHTPSHSNSNVNLNAHHQTPTSSAAQHRPTISADRYFRTPSRGNSFWKSTSTAASNTATTASHHHHHHHHNNNNTNNSSTNTIHRVDSTCPTTIHERTDSNTEDIRKFPIAITDIDLRRATAAALRAAAAEQEAAIYARTAEWSDLTSRVHAQFDVRSLSCYSVRSDLRPGSTTTAAFSPRLV
ncbi:uncharacterized protein RCC_10713 [Ramularia collo-cygni]|uniref:Uncharacterized protein n=1 Tax=Ramularia collo-cygni TaxID=112498 RepID=A0A2D3VPF9_9PEZI|nr:uncharacterized protein RCC_10713 [Ramularia collo-cygni]CZT24984.1 uncharacterized protein RCC_10713 [Ramularia collo-cygni]